MAEIDVLKAQIVRNNVNTPWGFRLQGGADYGQPLQIMRITPGSPAARIGLKTGDEVTEIGDTSTHGLTHTAAQEIIRQYGLSLILTVERRARGAIPVNPVVTPHNNAPAPLRTYQPYDMSGATSAPQPAPHSSSYDFQTVSSRPYEPPPEGPPYSSPVHHVSPSPPVAAATHPQQPQVNYHQSQPYQPQYNPAAYNDQPDGAQAQSRTFKMLEGLMSNEEPYAGTAGLPPPRSASLEKWKQDQKNAPSPRVKVFMPQQYNSPLGMYSAGNVIDTFATQAEVRMQNMETGGGKVMSEAQRAVLEEDGRI